MRMRTIGGFVALALTLAITGACGGGDDGGNEGGGGQAASESGDGGDGGGGSGANSEFCEQIDQLPGEGIALDFTDPEALRARVDALRAIEPPAEIADAYDRLMADYYEIANPDAPDTGDALDDDHNVVNDYLVGHCDWAA